MIPENSMKNARLVEIEIINRTEWNFHKGLFYFFISTLVCSIYHNSVNTSPNFSGDSFSERAKESLSKQCKTCLMNLMIIFEKIALKIKLFFVQIILV